MHYEFEPLKAFSLLDTRRVGQVDAMDIVQFLRDRSVVADFKDGSQIVEEYDAD